MLLSETGGQIPIPGDLIMVDRSEWYALPHGQRLRVCESAGWVTPGDEIFVAPRNAVSTFWGPNYGPPDGIKPEYMSTSGGPFRTLKLRELVDLQIQGTEVDQFWCWRDQPRAGGGVARQVRVTVWQLPLLIDRHYRESQQVYST